MAKFILFTPRFFLGCKKNKQSGDDEQNDLPMVGSSPGELVAVSLCTKPWWLVNNRIRTVLSSMGKGFLTLKLSETSSHAH